MTFPWSLTKKTFSTFWSDAERSNSSQSRSQSPTASNPGKDKKRSHAASQNRPNLFYHELTKCDSVPDQNRLIQLSMRRDPSINQTTRPNRRQGALQPPRKVTDPPSIYFSWITAQDLPGPKCDSATDLQQATDNLTTRNGVQTHLVTHWQQANKPRIPDIANSWTYRWRFFRPTLTLSMQGLLMLFCSWDWLAQYAVKSSKIIAKSSFWRNGGRFYLY